MELDNEKIKSCIPFDPIYFNGKFRIICLTHLIKQSGDPLNEIDPNTNRCPEGQKEFEFFKH